MEDAAKIPVNIPEDAASNMVHEVSPPELDDRDLVERCQRGELGAYEGLVGRYRGKVYGLAFSMLRNEQDAIFFSGATGGVVGLTGCGAGF